MLHVVNTINHILHCSLPGIVLFGVGWLAPAAFAQEDGDTPSIIIHQRSDNPDPDPDPGAEILDSRALNRQLAAAAKEIDRLNARLQSAAEKYTDAQAKIAQHEADAKAMGAQMKEAARRLREFDDQLKVDARQIAALTAERDDALAETAQRDGEIKALREKIKAHTIVAEERGRELRALRDANENAAAAATGMTSDSVDLLKKANDELHAGNVQEAAVSYRQGMARWPGVTAFRLGLATCHYYSGNPGVAIRFAEEVLDGDSRNADALGLLGILAWERGDLRDAGKYLGKAIKHKPDDAQLHIYRGMVLYDRKKYDDAMESLLHAVQLSPSNVSARYNLAVLLAGRNDEPDLAQARIQYEASKRLGGEEDPALEQLLYP